MKSSLPWQGSTREEFIQQHIHRDLRSKVGSLNDNALKTMGKTLFREQFKVFRELCCCLDSDFLSRSNPQTCSDSSLNQEAQVTFVRKHIHKDLHARVHLLDLASLKALGTRPFSEQRAAFNEICTKAGRSVSHALDKPTHFVAVRITDPMLISQLQQLQQHLLETVPGFNALHRQRFHLTLFGGLYLTSTEDVSVVKDIVMKTPLEDLGVQVTSTFSFHNGCMVTAMGNPDLKGNNVLVAKVVSDSEPCPLASFREDILTRLRDAGVRVPMVNIFQPHITLGRSGALDFTTSQLERSIGIFRLDGLHLCRHRAYGEDGFYATE